MTAKLPTMVPIENSSNVVAVGYQPDDRYLFVQFKSGMHKFEDVSPALHEKFMASESKGKFFASEIRGQHQSSKVPHEKRAEEKAE